MSDKYEFSEEENLQFKDFLNSILMLSGALIISGLIIFIEGVIPDVSWGSIVVGLIFIGIAVAFFLPVRNFRAIIETEGDDMNEFMTGFGKLSDGMTLILGASMLLLLTLIVVYFASFL